MNNLEFGAAFSRVFDLYGKHAKPLLIWSAVVQFALAILTALFITVILTGAGVGAAVLSGAVLAAIAVVGSAVLTGTYIVGLHDAGETGDFPSFGDVWPKVQPRIGALIVTSLLAGLGIALGFILLIVPGLVLLTWWAVFSPVVMLENQSGPGALGRSRELVSGNGWTVFGLVLVVMILTQIASGIIGGIVGALLGGKDEFLGSFGSQFVSGTLLAPVSALLAIVIYEALSGGGTDQTLPPAAPAAQQYDPTTPPAPPAPSDQSGPFV